MTHVIRRPDWALDECDVTPEDRFWSRRRVLRGLAATCASGTIAAGTGGCATAPSGPAPLTDDAAADLPPAQRSDAFALGDDVTPGDAPAAWNNYLEFGADKSVWKAAQDLRTRPWTVRIDGLVETPVTLDVAELIRRMPVEERIYRFRCIEKWAFVAPWTGFALSALADYARPLASARYLRMESFSDAFTAPGQFKFWHPWPYHEGLTMAEATHELAFLAVGVYGRPLPKQQGAPLRLVVPWKYGYKSIKAIRRFTFTDRNPGNFWGDSRPDLYGFWANVHPEVDHPFAPQTHEYLLGTQRVRETEVFNGYGRFVADLYKGMDDARLFV